MTAWHREICPRSLKEVKAKARSRERHQQLGAPPGSYGVGSETVTERVAKQYRQWAVSSKDVASTGGLEVSKKEAASSCMSGVEEGCSHEPHFLKVGEVSEFSGGTES